MRGRHAGAGYLSRSAWITAVIIVLVAAAVGGVAYWRMGSETGCGGGVSLTVAVTPEIVPAVRDTAQEWAADARGPNGECVAVEVVGAAPADVALAIADEAGVSLAGILPTELSTPVPDVWVPDSSSWLLRVAAADPNLVPTQGASVARSPIVIAMPEPVAASLGWPTTEVSWTALLQRVTTSTPLKIGIVEPNRDATGLSGLLALGSAAATAGPTAQQVTVAAMRSLVAGRASLTSDLYARFPKSAEPAELVSALNAAPLSEQAVIAYNAGNPSVRLAALYVSPAPHPLDYPFAVLPKVNGAKAALAEDLRNALRGEAYSDRLGELGLRDPDGSGRGRTFPILPGAPSTVAAAPLDAAMVGRVLTNWTEITKPARMLAVIDVSGSMLSPVPTANGATRSQVAKGAAETGLSLFDDTWAVGLWAFSTNLDGDKDYRQILPIAPMATQRPLLQEALAQVNPIPNGSTGLYDTVLAAYQTVQQGWDPVAINSVVILTDGQNDNPGGLTLDSLIAQLQSIMDPKRPVQVIAVGIGDEVSEAELKRITDTTGGGTFVARDPSAIGPIFLQAISLRPSIT